MAVAKYPNFGSDFFNKHTTLAYYLSRGGSGNVFGPILWHGLQLALKQVMFADGKVTDKFKKDIEVKKDIWTSLEHKHLTRIHSVDLSQLPQAMFIAMEFAAGGSLHKTLRSFGSKNKLPIDVVTNWAKQIAEGMLYLHEKNIVHRDLKSSNILLMEPYDILNSHTIITLKIADFDEVKVHDHTTTMSLVGTCAYMAPEVLVSQRFSKTSDIWSYGVVLWEMLSGDIPHKELEEREIIYKSMNGQLDNLPIEQSFPKDYKLLLNRCWESVSEERPSFHDIFCVLERVEHVQRIKAKYTILVEGLSCFQEVVAMMYEKCKLTQEGKEDILKFVESCELYSASERLLDIVMSGPIEVYNCFLEALQQTRQNDVYSMLVNKNKSLSTEEENALPHNRIRGIFIWLTENLYLDCDLLSHLYAERVLTQSEFEKIAMDIHVSNTTKVHWFLSIIGRKSYDDFATFIQLLEKTNQAHASKKLLQPMPFQTQKQEKQINHSGFDKHCKRNALTARRLWDAMKITNRMEEDLNDPDDNTHETEISTKVLSLQRKAKIISDDIIQDCIKQLLQDMDLAKKECVQAKGDYNRLHTELDQSREALKRTKRPNATNKDDARLKQSYEQMRKDAKLIGIIKTNAAKKSNKAVWGVTILENKMYVVSRWTPEVEVFETVKFTCINRCTLDGLDNPEDIRASVKGKHLFIMDATRPAKAKKILRVEPNGMKVAVKWKVGEHEAILSVTEESNVIATVYENHQLIEYTSDGEEVHRIDLSNTCMMHPWHAVKLTNGHFLVCHGHHDEPVHRVCEIDHNGLILKSFGDATNFHNLDVPMNLAVDKFGSIIVADYRNGLVLLLSSDLKDKKVLLSKEFGIRRPARLHLDEESGRLIIADNKSGLQNGRVLVFEIKLVD